MTAVTYHPTLPDPDVTFYDRRGIPCARRVYHGAVTYTSSGPFGGDLVIAYGALCVDGKRRTARPSGDGTADTFFSIPAFVYVRNVRVYGSITIETMQGFTTETENDPLTVKFFAYTYRKHNDAIRPPTPS